MSHVSFKPYNFIPCSSTVGNTNKLVCLRETMTTLYGKYVCKYFHAKGVFTLVCQSSL